MNTRNNREIIDDIVLRCSEKLDKQMYLLENILGERDTLSLLEDSLYFYIAGNVLMLKPDGTDVSNNPTLENEEHVEYYDKEREVITKYLLTLIHFEINEEHDEALDDCINMLETTTRTFNREFLNVIHLIVLFDKDELYQNLCMPLAYYCISIIYNEYQMEENKK